MNVSNLSASLLRLVQAPEMRVQIKLFIEQRQATRAANSASFYCLPLHLNMIYLSKPRLPSQTKKVTVFLSGVSFWPF